jgi:hypothetical protein
MDRIFPKIYLDYKSVLVGILLSAALLYLFFRYRIKLKESIISIASQIRILINKVSAPSETNYLQNLYKYVQTKHIASNLCPLEAILIPPKCIVPPPKVIPGEDTLDPSLLQQTLGYDPALSDLASEYFAPTLSLLEALSGGANLLLLGYPGTGKSVALADCTTSLLWGNSESSELMNKIPIWVEAQNILPQFPGSDVLEVLINAVQDSPAFSTIPNLPKYLTSTINSGNALLLIDGIDGLSPNNTNRIANYLIALCKKISSLQIAAAASPSFLGNLVRAPFEFISIAPWNHKSKNECVEKWSKLWGSKSYDESNTRIAKHKILGGMLVDSDQNLTPLEFTLKVWASFAGDLAGPAATQSLHSYLTRFPSISIKYPFRSLDTLSIRSLAQDMDSFSKQDIHTWVSQEKYQPALRLEDDQSSPNLKDIQIALDHNILGRTGQGRYYFTNQTFGGYFAARGLARLSQTAVYHLLNKPDWALRHETNRFFSAFKDIEPYFNSTLTDQSQFKEKLVDSCAWLRYTRSPNGAQVQLLKAITIEIQSNPIYLVKLRLIISLAKSGNPDVYRIIRHLLGVMDPDTKRAAALAAGFIVDHGATSQLIGLLNDSFPVSTAACYALGKLSSPTALEAIAESLLHGDELLRRAAAETLAQNRSEGHPALREGATRKDLLVRYAVVHGLGLIDEKWALDILDKMRIDEDEWIVRDLAQQVFDTITSKTPFAPQPLKPLHLAFWLRKFAEQHNLVMLTRETALELLLKALEMGSDEQKQAALLYLRRSSVISDHIGALIPVLDSNNPAVQQLAAVTIWLCTPPGYQAPDLPNG